MRHPLDPPKLHAFAETLGTIEALGLLRPGEASAEIAAAVGRLPPNLAVDRSGLQARLNHSMHDAAHAIGVDRREADRAIRAAVSPLVAANRPSSTIRAAAERERGPLTVAEAHAIAFDQALRDSGQ